jgi:hypothetical protein
MDAAPNSHDEEKQRLLTRLAELMIEEQVEQGVFLGTPHYSIIERAAMKLGRDLSRQAQERGAREVAARCAAEVACPSCQAMCRVEVKKRKVTSTDGPVELTETVAFCCRCKRSFFPSAGGVGHGQSGSHAGVDAGSHPPDGRGAFL